MSPLPIYKKTESLIIAKVFKEQLNLHEHMKLLRFPSSSLKKKADICYCSSDTKTQIGASLGAEIEQPNLMRVKGFNLNVYTEKWLICFGGTLCIISVGVINWCLCLLAQLSVMNTDYL